MSLEKDYQAYAAIAYTRNGRLRLVEKVRKWPSHQICMQLIWENPRMMMLMRATVMTQPRLTLIEQQSTKQEQESSHSSKNVSCVHYYGTKVFH